MSRWVLGLCLVLAAALAVPSAASAEVRGSATGWSDPATYDPDDPAELSVQATPDGVALQNATATLGGKLLDVKGFADGSCTQTCPATVALEFDTRKVADGQRELVVWVTDQEGTETELLRRFITVENTPRPTPCPREDIRDPCNITVQVGSGSISPQPSPPGGGPVGPSASSCASPRLSMRLAQKPLRYRRGVPVLVRGKTYRYAGELTCRINGRRRPAPRGMSVQVRNRLRGWTITKPSIQVRKDGEVVARLAYRSSRVIIFRVRGAGGDLASVRIPIRVVRAEKGGR